MKVRLIRIADDGIEPLWCSHFVPGETRDLSKASPLPPEHTIEQAREFPNIKVREVSLYEVELPNFNNGVEVMLQVISGKPFPYDESTLREVTD